MAINTIMIVWYVIEEIKLCIISNNFYFFYFLLLPSATIPITQYKNVMWPFTMIIKVKAVVYISLKSYCLTLKALFGNVEFNMK